MPTRNLTPADNFQTVSQWLDAKLQGPIVPTATNLNCFPQEKGLYFWFMNPEGYAEISSIISITPVETRYQKILDGILYDLVYLGTAGTGKQGLSNLRTRLQWHISQNHNHSTICSGGNSILSTLRTGLGSLISNDLIDGNTEQSVNDLFKRYFKIFWITYGNDQKEHIDSDEKLLIKQLTPLLNIRNNPKSSKGSEDNSTRKYRVRRNIVYKDTRIRLGCKSENSEKQKKYYRPTKESLNYEHQIIEQNDNCIEFTVTAEQSIADVVRGIPDLPTGECQYLIMDSLDRDRLIYANSRGNSFRTTGSKSGQNIYTCFSNTDESYAKRIGYNTKTPRWKIIQQEMYDSVPPVSEIIVKVCQTTGNRDTPNENSTIFQPTTKPIVPNIGKAAKALPLTDDKSKIIYLIPCSSLKIIISNLEKFKEIKRPLSFDAELGNLRKGLINMVENSSTHIRKLGGELKRIRVQEINLKNTAQAKYVYGPGKLFDAAESEKWDNEQASRVYIVSALFGLIRADDTIPLYDLAMKDTLKFRNKEFTPKEYWSGKLDDCAAKLLETHEIYNLLSLDYEKVFGSVVLNKLKKPNLVFANTDRSSRPAKRGKWLKMQLRH